MSIIIIGLACISTIIFSLDYSYELNNYCEIFFQENRLKLRNLEENFIKDCTKFSSTNENETENNIYSDIIKVVWLISMSAHNIKNYLHIFKYKANDDQKYRIEDVTLDYSFLYFISGITILIVNLCKLQIIPCFLKKNL